MKLQKSKTKEVISLAIPNIASNITVPLLSLVDTAIAGHMTTKNAIAAVAVAATLTNTLYWLWGFLRMVTTGIVAQAYGRKDDKAITKQLAVGMTIAMTLGITLIVIRPLLYKCLLLVANNNSDITQEATTYFKIILLGAPSILSSYVINGWFIGMQNTRLPMVIAITTNIINIFISIILTRSFNMGVAGLAWGTVIAQYIGVIISIFLAQKKFQNHIKHIKIKDCIDTKVLKIYFHLGKDLMLRTVLMSTITFFFAHIGSRYGANIVSANALLMLLFTIFSYFMDGFAYSAEALVGRYIGEKQYNDVQKVINTLFVIGSIMAILTSLIYIFFSKDILALLSDKPVIIDQAMQYITYMIFVPIVSFIAFILDGVFVGATSSNQMRNTIIISTIVFFIVYFIASPFLSEEALWLGFVLYLSTRSVYQLAIYNRVVKKSCSSQL